MGSSLLSGAILSTFSWSENRRSGQTRTDASGSEVSTYTYDRDDRLTGVEVRVGSVSTTTVYTLDKVGNRTREVVSREGSTLKDIAYTYTAKQRLTRTEDAISGQITDYDYDARGHLIEETVAGQTTTYRPNAQDRLATLTLPGAPPIDYAYDAEGKRVERRSSSELTRFGWDGQSLRRETNAANNVIEAHDWAAGRILQSRRLTTTRYAQHDALKSPIRWSQAGGSEQGQLRYDAWGTTTDTSSELPRIAYTGHYREREGTAYYAQQRYYRPGVGRFNRVDPWEGDTARPITLNKYLYANGNPLAFIDPDGRAGWPNSWEDMPGYERPPVNEMHYVGGSPEARQAALDNMSPEHAAQYYQAQVRGAAITVSLVPGTALARGLYGVGRATWAAYRMGGALHGATVATTQGAALTESAVLTGVSVSTGAEVPSVVSAPAAMTSRLVRAAGRLDDVAHAVPSLGRVSGEAASNAPASLLSPGAATNRVVQQSKPVHVVEGFDSLRHPELAPSSSRIHSIRDARRLEGENRGVIFVREPQRSGSAGEFESGATGAFSAAAENQSRIVPALRFDNPNPRGNNFVRFDGYEDGGRTLVDRKMQLTTKTKQLADLERVSRAAAQNPDYRVIYEFPTEEAASSARRILQSQQITNVEIRVSSE